MRIISGKLKGRRLNSFKANHLRPTTDRVKEVIFNKLMGYIDGARVLDLFSGTGNLSIEAYSRGAAEIVAVEKSPKSIKILKSNLQELSVTEFIQIMPVDVFQFLKKADGPPFDIIFIDPPFTQKIAHEVLLALQSTSLFGPETMVVIESTKHEKIEDEYGTLNLLDRKDYGDKYLSFFKYREEKI